VVGLAFDSLRAPPPGPLMRNDPAVLWAALPTAIVGLAGIVIGLMLMRERSLSREAYDERIAQIDQELGW
jgi:hypothetical protein